MLTEENWDCAEYTIFEESKKAIMRFAESETSDPCSFFALSSDYVFGDITICFDTYNNSLLHAKRHDARVFTTRANAFASANSWTNARHYLQRDSIGTFPPHTSEFTFPEFATIHLPDWESHFAIDFGPENPDPIGHVIIVLHNAICRLMNAGSFECLAMSSPFYVGIEFPTVDRGITVLKILNWPPHQGTRV